MPRTTPPVRPSSLWQTVRRNLPDLEMVQYGTQYCAPSHSYGPAVRDHWLVHFIHEGRGRFHSNGQVWHLGPGDGFLICPDQVTLYEAEWQDPWHYSWIGFWGSRAASLLEQAGLSTGRPVFHDHSGAIADCIADMAKAFELERNRNLRLLGHLHLFLAALADVAEPSASPGETRGRREAYVAKAIEFFRMNYARPIGVGDAAARVGLDRSYFSEIFHAEAGLAPRDFLIGLRMEKACQFLGNAGLSIGDVARSVGYDDPLLFSKVFRKTRGLSPRAFRKAGLSGGPSSG